MKVIRIILALIASALQVFALAARGEYVTKSSDINAIILEDEKDALRSDKDKIKSDSKAIYGDMRNAWKKVVQSYG